MISSYQVVSVPYVVDGDTLWVVRRRVIGDVEGGTIIYEDNVGGVAVRLHDGGLGLNTPEKHGVGSNASRWAAARADLTAWVAANIGVVPGVLAPTSLRLELRVYGRDKYGRLLGNLHSVSGDAVRHMIERGWATYEPLPP